MELTRWDPKRVTRDNFESPTQLSWHTICRSARSSSAVDISSIDQTIAWIQIAQVPGAASGARRERIQHIPQHRDRWWELVYPGMSAFREVERILKWCPGKRETGDRHKTVYADSNRGSRWVSCCGLNDFSAHIGLTALRESRYAATDPKGFPQRTKFACSSTIPSPGQLPCPLFRDNRIL
jgi:hypothetical protein